MAKAKKEEMGSDMDPIEIGGANEGSNTQTINGIEITSKKEEDKPEKVINAAKEVVVSMEEKKVRIHAIEDNECIISGVPYVLKKDKDYVVPSDVAAILCYGGKAYRL